MRLKLATILVFGLLFSTVFQSVTVAQEAPPAQTIPITSTGFGAKLSPDGKILVTYENTVLLDLKAVDPTMLPLRVFNISTGKQVGTLSGFSDFASEVAFTSDSRRLISVHMNGDLNVWDLASMKVLKTIQTPLLGNIPFQIFPDNKRIMALLGPTPQHFLIIDTQSGAITQTVGIHLDSFLDFQQTYNQFPAQGDLMFASFALSPDGKVLATATINDEVGLRTIADNQYQVVREKSKQAALFSIRQLLFTRDGKSLIYFDLGDNQTHIWDIGGKSEKAKLAIGSDTMVLSPDGKQVAWVTRAKGIPSTVSVAALDAPDKAAVILTLPDGLQVAPRITWLTFTPDGKQVVVGGFFAEDATTNQIYVLDVPS